MNLAPVQIQKFDESSGMEMIETCVEDFKHLISRLLVQLQVPPRTTSTGTLVGESIEIGNPSQ